jgi:hypothetical protein
MPSSSGFINILEHQLVGYRDAGISVETHWVQGLTGARSGLHHGCSPPQHGGRMFGIKALPISSFVFSVYSQSLFRVRFV